MTNRAKAGEGSTEAKRGGRNGDSGNTGPIKARFGGLPLDMLLTTARGSVHIELDDPKANDIKEAEFRIDKSEWVELTHSGTVWEGYLQTEGLNDGQYEIELRARRANNKEERVVGTFRVRSSAR